MERTLVKLPWFHAHIALNSIPRIGFRLSDSPITFLSYIPVCKQLNSAMTCFNIKAWLGPVSSSVASVKNDIMLK